jgi:hypothetical protein
VHRQVARHPLLDEGVGHHPAGAAQHQGRARPAERGVPQGGEHLGAQRVDHLHLAEVADDRRWVLGQLLEDGPLDLWGGGQVEVAGQGQDHASPATWTAESASQPSICVSSHKYLIPEFAHQSNRP